MNSNSSPRGTKVLFITSNRVGDAILSTGVLAHLSQAHPDLRMSIACGPVAASLFTDTPFVEDVILMRKQRRAGHWIALWRQAVRQRWDLAIDLRGSLVTYGLWAKRRLVRLSTSHDCHRVEDIARVLGVSPPPSPHIWVSDQRLADARAMVPSDRPAIAIAPTANWAAKIWPAERFAELVQRITAPGKPLAGAQILVLGGPGEQEMAAPLIAALPAERVTDLVGLSLLDTYACLQYCKLFVGNDSGLMHLSAASGIPTVGLFGPTRDDLYAPWGANALCVRTDLGYDDIFPPNFDHRTSPTLMLGLPVERVEAAVNGLLAD